MNREFRKNFEQLSIFMRILMLHLLILTLIGWFAGAAQSQEPVVMTCTADELIIDENGSLEIHAWITGSDLVARKLEWEQPKAGQIANNRAHTRWDLSGVSSGAYGATANLFEAGTLVSSCTVSVVVEIESETKGLTTGRNFLVENDSDDPAGAKYGLYSYLIILSSPTANERNRYLIVIANFLRKSPEILELENYAVPRSELNIAYIPVTSLPNNEISDLIAKNEFLSASSWVLSNYDWARASVIAGKISDGPFRGPLIVSYKHPLTSASDIDTRHLIVQDYSSAPPNLIPSMIHRFFDRAGQTNWSSSKVEDFASELVTIFSVIAEGVIDSRSAVKEWISWGASVRSE